jgi:hypothetical protein
MKMAERHTPKVRRSVTWKTEVGEAASRLNKGYRGRIFYLFIYSMSFNVIQPMWLCRNIPTHKIADMSKRRN